MRHEDFGRPRGKTAAGEVGGNRLPEDRKPEARVAVVAEERPGVARGFGERLFERRRDGRHVKPEERDRRSARIDEPAERGVAAAGRVPGRLERRDRGAGARDARAASLDALEPPLVAKSLIGPHDGRPADPERLRELALGRDRGADGERAFRDRRSDRVGQLPIDWTASRTPVPQVPLEFGRIGGASHCHQW